MSTCVNIGGTDIPVGNIKGISQISVSHPRREKFTRPIGSRYNLLHSIYYGRYIDFFHNRWPQESYEVDVNGLVGFSVEYTGGSMAFNRAFYTEQEFEEKKAQTEKLRADIMAQIDAATFCALQTN